MPLYYTAPKVYKDLAYAGVCTFTATVNPSGVNSGRYSWWEFNGLITLNLFMNFAVAGTMVSVFNIPLPSDCPAPLEVTGLGAASTNLYTCFGILSTATTTETTARGILMVNAGDTGWQVEVTGTAASYKICNVTVQYFKA